ncbi:uncharacterized protein LOC115319391 [Ixodes scapularis]|uniref:uncharacterized protein LOC115319391 n=1 Tax=Ixodes scapularis TaxID=6945 RepID=UPI001A9EC802|nr:uncharacterized protein LOC115319391 [Ixodes scapularis]
MRILLLLLLLSGLRLGANGSDTDNVPRPGNGTVAGEGNSSSSDSPAFWPSFSLFFRDHHKETPKDDDDHRHDWHRRYFHRFLPLVGIVVLALVATCLCLGYACSSRDEEVYLLQTRPVPFSEPVPMYALQTRNPNIQYSPYEYTGGYTPPHAGYSTFEAYPKSSVKPTAPPVY